MEKAAEWSRINRRKVELLTELKDLEAQESNVFVPSPQATPLKLSDAVLNGGIRPVFALEFGSFHFQIKVELKFGQPKCLPNDLWLMQRISFRATIRPGGNQRSQPLEPWLAKLEDPWETHRNAGTIGKAKDYLNQLNAGWLKEVHMRIQSRSNLTKGRKRLDMRIQEKPVPGVGFEEYRRWDVAERSFIFGDKELCLLWIRWVMIHDPKRMAVLWPELYEAIPDGGLLGHIASFVGPQWQ